MLVRPISAVGWELRGALASRRPVVLSLSERCTQRRLEGRVNGVAATDAYCVVQPHDEPPLHIPLEDVLAVHRPHFTQHADQEVSTT